MIEQQAEFILEYDMKYYRFKVKKSRYLDPLHELTCMHLVKQHLGFDVTARGEWCWDADETHFLLKYA
jgi:hypothetical protein